MAIDEQLVIKGCIKGERDAQRTLYEKYAPGMFAVCRRYAKGQQEAEDILQDAFIKVFDQIGKFRGESTIGYWIKRIVINTALNSERSKLYLYPMVDVTEMHNTPDESIRLSDYTMDELMKMIDKLPSSCKAIFNLYAIEGYKHQEIADMLGISEGTSKSQFARARQLLKEQMKPRWQEKTKDS